ncbi:hypothetical protein EV401DRAFT_1886265 [Pisolithus croceorrhizus]|nr:hypothetical protein EV401DRAFT_1886265 [Pisolithus croceorrhizus]
MKAWVIVRYRDCASESVAGTIGNTDTGDHRNSSTHGIGSMDAKFTSVQVPQFKSDLRGGAVDIVAVASHVTVSRVAWVVLSTQSRRAEQSKCQRRPGQRSTLTEVPEQAPAEN